MALSIPTHVAIIMDGNGRWATNQGLERTAGHEEGAKRVREITRACKDLGVKVLTLYSFSTENWKRPEKEISILWDILKRYLKQEKQEMMTNGIRLNAIGQIERLPMFVRLPLKALMRETSQNKDMTLNLALSYGSRAEMIFAVQKLVKEAQERRITSADITEELFSQQLFTAGMPDPELVIRTSGEMRLSNFLMWQAAYAELYITDVSWPEFTKEHLLKAFTDFGQRQRRFGLTGQQIERGNEG